MSPFHRRTSSERTTPRMEQDSLRLTTTLFLGDISVLCSEIHLRELFGRYGTLERVQLKKSDRDPHRAHLGFGFVKFSSRMSAERALEELNGCFFMGRALRVGWAEDYNRVGGEVKARDPKKSRETAQLHVSFVCEDAMRMVSEMELGLVFGVFGNVVDIAIKKNVLNKSGVQSGYAFVHFALTLEGLESAFAAAERVNNTTIDCIRYKCKTDQALLMQYLSLKPRDVSEPSNTMAFTHVHALAPASMPAPVHGSFGHNVRSHPELLHLVNRETIPPQRTFKQGIPSLPHTLHFSTYGSSAEAENIYSSPTSSSGGSFSYDQRSINKSVLCNERTSVTRSLSSAKENDFLRSPVLVFSKSPSPLSSSLSSSSSNDEYPSYRRYTTNM